MKKYIWLVLSCLALTSCEHPGQSILGFRFTDSEATTKDRTYTLRASEEFEKSFWYKRRTTIIPDVAVAPDGTSTADALIDDDQDGDHQVNQVPILDDDTIYTASIHAKPNGHNFLLIFIRDKAFTPITAWFDVAEGKIGTISGPAIDAKIAPAANGFFRASVTFNSASGEKPGLLFIFTADADNSRGHTGDGTSGLIIWGAQVNEGDSPAPYVKSE